MSTVTKFPVVLVHGLFGHGKERPLWNTIPYWPEKDLARINPNHIIVDVGTVSSDHDRACEAFYELYGGTVDYGEEHVRKTHHERFGRTYNTPRHPHWSEDNPIHLVGHSMGSTTAIELYQMLCDDAFGVGSNHKWVRSITCIAGPLTGSTFSHMFVQDLQRPYSVLYMMSAVMSVWFKLYQRVPFLRGAYDFRSDQWRNFSLRELVSANGVFNRTMDLAMHSCMPSNRMERNSQLKNMEKVHLMSITTSPRHFDLPLQEIGGAFLLAALNFGKIPRLAMKWPRVKNFREVCTLVLGYFLWKRIRKLNFAKLPGFYALSWIIRRRTKLHPDLYDDVWEHNDGAVNIHSMLRPWFPKPDQLPRLQSDADAADTGPVGQSQLTSSASTTSLQSSPSVPSLASLARCASHISIDGFHHEQDEPLDESESPRRSRFEKGRWYVYRVDCNHLAGTYWDGEAADLYESLFKMIINEYEPEQKDTTTLTTTRDVMAEHHRSRQVFDHSGPATIGKS
ncbi:hypothetical protein Poli38472_007044 [Pythium oligandrum]|uniref:Lipase-like C-terminal domain-containing protein n=1 Tax=Pythium oligandrum TaxID=41045 RepID=A0A8K1C906_PYTOL|nr:hypothetical protein Poli38472_007044 [Pythium oligandrum]|eukprot:TMW58899.1 hypothetical protein Poli38472_007044 [Pythium oligandrum]